MASYVPDDACGEAALPYWLVCAPSRATHNSTYSHSPRHVARMGPPCVHVARADFERLALVEGQRVRLCNARGRLTLPARPSDDLPGGMLRIDGLPRAKDLPEGVGVNTLVSDSVSDLGEGNVLYSTRVELQALEETRAQAHIR
jgi:anaerobic selenocysteine-containing dehydrogenase